MRRSAKVGEVAKLLKLALAKLPPAHRQALEGALMAPQKLAVEDSLGGFVVALAAFEGRLLYWSDVEEGWELEVPSKTGTIPSRGCELAHVLWQILSPANAA